MKGVDTPVLLEVLRGTAAARRWVRSLKGEELATTEINLWELTVLAHSDPAPGRDRRLATLERLRRKLLVFPVDARGVRGAARPNSRRGTGPSALSGLVAGTLESNGCNEWVTSPNVARAGSLGRLRVVHYGK